MTTGVRPLDDDHVNARRRTSARSPGTRRTRPQFLPDGRAGGPADVATCQVVGWREWVRLPVLGDFVVKAKIDTGARSSALHAFNVETFRRRGALWVRFHIHPKQRNIAKTVHAEAPVLEHRTVRSSSGHLTQRPVIQTELELFGARWPIELTLANRDQMGFRLLLGREALRRRLIVDPSRSYLAGRR